MTKLSVYQDGTCPACPAPFNMAAHVLRQAQVVPDKTALEIIGPESREIFSFTDLRVAVQSAAAGLRAQGLKSGDRIILRIGNTVDFPIVFLGAIAAGFVPVATSSQLTAPELSAIVDDLSPSLICVGGGLSLPTGFASNIDMLCDLRALRDHAPDPFVPGDPNRAAYIVYSSGTSGKPHAVEHAHRAIWARQMMFADWYDMRDTDRLMHSGAFNWTYTLGTGLMDPWTVGATAIISAGTVRRGELAGLLRAGNATIFAATPGVLRQLLAGNSDLNVKGLRHTLSAGEKLSPQLRAMWQARSGRPVYEAMGMSEVSTFLSSSPSRQTDEGAVGTPQKGRRVAVLDPISNLPVPLGKPGILAVATTDPGLMRGYANGPSAVDGEWFLTGDLVRMAPNGSVTFLGRNDDMMNAGGFRVSPVEVETVLAAHPDIITCAVTSHEVKTDAHIIVAFYLSKSPLNVDGLRSHCAASLAAYKCPRMFVRLDSLPTGSNGKLRRRALQSLVPHDQT